MRVLIPGGSGFIGSNIAIYLKKKYKNIEIISVDNLSRNTSHLNLPILKKHKIQNIKIDISSNFFLSKINELNKKFDFIIDCCAEPAVEKSKNDIDLVFNSNLKSTLNILKLAKVKSSKIIFLSTSRVYSINEINKIFLKKNLKNKLKKKLTICENFPTTSPISIYGFTKISSEMLIKEFSYLYNLKYIINRLGVVSGKGQIGKQDQGFVSLWLWRNLNELPISYNGFGGYGNQVRDILDISDLCKLIDEQMKKISKIYNLTFNVGGGIKNSLSLKELTSFSEKIVKKKIRLFSNKNTSRNDIIYYITDNKKIYSKYKWRVKKNLNEILTDTYNYLLKLKNVLNRLL